MHWRVDAFIQKRRKIQLSEVTVEFGKAFRLFSSGLWSQSSPLSPRLSLPPG